MGFVRRGGGGGGGGDEGGGDEEQGVSIKRCEVCRRELLPWEDTCPDDGGRAITPQEVEPEHDALLARLLADEDETVEVNESDAAGVADAAKESGVAGAADEDGTGEGGDGDVEPGAAATGDEPTWPGREGPSRD